MDDLAYSAVAVANEFLRRARESYRALSATQLHELVYCAQGWHLVVAGVPLISGAVAAHRGGVFIPDLKNAGCWGTAQVIGLLHDVGQDASFPRVDDGTAARFTIDHVWADYGPLSRYDLTRLTVTPGSPWDQVWNMDGQHDSQLIPSRLLREWFGKIATWRTAAENVSVSVDRCVQEDFPMAAKVAAHPAYNEAMQADSDQVHDLRHQLRRAHGR